MTSEKVRIPLAEAEAIAAEVITLLEPVCQRVEVAGSIRRRKETVGDVEIVCIPRTEFREAGLFGEPVPINLEYELAHELRKQGVLQDRPDTNGHPCFGERFQRVVFKGFALDLFCVLPPAQFGVILAIRTGPETFSRRMVTSRVAAEHGRLPMGFYVKDGALYDRGRLIETPEERSFFDAIDYPWREPEERF